MNKAYLIAETVKNINIQRANSPDSFEAKAAVVRNRALFPLLEAKGISPVAIMAAANK